MWAAFDPAHEGTAHITARSGKFAVACGGASPGNPCANKVRPDGAASGDGRQVECKHPRVDWSRTSRPNKARALPRDPAARRARYPGGGALNGRG